MENFPKNDLHSILSYMDDSVNASNNKKKISYISSKDKMAITFTLGRLDVYNININEIMQVMNAETIFNLVLQYWVIKELYFSPYKKFLNNLTHQQFVFKFYKSKNYVNPKENAYHFLNYFIKTLQQDFYKEKKEITEAEVQQ